MKYLITSGFIAIFLGVFLYTEDIRVKASSVFGAMGAVVLLSTYILKKQKPVLVPQKKLLGGMGIFLLGSVATFLLPHPVFIEISGRMFFFPIAPALVGYGTLLFLEGLIHFLNE